MFSSILHKPGKNFSSQNHGLVWVGRNFKAHPVPGMDREPSLSQGAQGFSVKFSLESDERKFEQF